MNFAQVYGSFGILSLSVLLSTKSLAASSNLLTCTNVGTSFLSGCALTKSELGGLQSFETEFKVKYRFPCSGPAMDFYFETPVKPESGSATTAKQFEYVADYKTIEIIGFGPVTVLDRSPNKTSTRPFSKSCSVEVELVSAKASPNQKSIWQKNIADLQVLLTSYSDNARAFEALALLEPAFQVYDQLISLAAKDFSNDNEVLDAAKELLSCADGTTDEGCETIISKIIDSRKTIGFSDEEGRKLIKLQNTLLNADFNGVLKCEKEKDPTCTPISQFLKKYLSADDIKKLTDARNKLSQVKDAPEKFQTYTGLVTQTQNSILSIQNLIKANE